MTEEYFEWRCNRGKEAQPEFWLPALRSMAAWVLIWSVVMVPLKMGILPVLNRQESLARVMDKQEQIQSILTGGVIGKREGYTVSSKSEYLGEKVIMANRGESAIYVSTGTLVGSWITVGVLGTSSRICDEY